MKSKLRVALLGDYDAGIISHQFIPTALLLAGAGTPVEPVWVSTAELGTPAQEWLKDFDGLWCVPGSPYKNRAAVLEAIRFARTSEKPYLGTCGGYQHAILEFARSVLDLKDADSEEEDPITAEPLIYTLPCRLTNEARKVRVAPRSKLHAICGPTLDEEYFCGFGVNPRYVPLFKTSALQFDAFNDEGEPQALEIPFHRFFFATAFQPERSARGRKAHPLIRAFVQAMAR